MKEDKNITNINEHWDGEEYNKVLIKELVGNNYLSDEWVNENISAISTGFELGRKHPDEQTIKRILALQYIWTNCDKEKGLSLFEYIIRGLNK